MEVLFHSTGAYYFFSSFLVFDSCPLCGSCYSTTCHECPFPAFERSFALFPDDIRFFRNPQFNQDVQISRQIFAWQGKNAGILADFNGFHEATARSQSKQFLTKSKQKIYRQYVCHN